MLRATLTILIALTCAAMPGYAEDLPAPREFFDQGFVDETGSENRKERGTEAARSELPLRPRVTPRSARGSYPAARKRDEAAHSSDDASSGDQSDIFKESEPIKIHSVGAILNSLDMEHFTSALTELTETAIRYDLTLSTVYTIGDISNLTKVEPFLYRILGRGGAVNVLDRPPLKYNVAMSPSWIVKTEKGEYLLEGTGSLAAYLTQKGEFLDKQRNKELVAAEPAAANQD